MDCMNCGQKRSFNRGIYYVDMTNDKSLKLSEVCKEPENKFYYLFAKTTLQIQVCLSNVF